MLRIILERVGSVAIRVRTGQVPLAIISVTGDLHTPTADKKAKDATYASTAFRVILNDCAHGDLGAGCSL